MGCKVTVALWQKRGDLETNTFELTDAPRLNGLKQQAASRMHVRCGQARASEAMRARILLTD